jgi:hypothetical protein
MGIVRDISPEANGHGIVAVTHTVTDVEIAPIT